MVVSSIERPDDDEAIIIHVTQIGNDIEEAIVIVDDELWIMRVNMDGVVLLTERGADV